VEQGRLLAAFAFKLERKNLWFGQQKMETFRCAQDHER